MTSLRWLFRALAACALFAAAACGPALPNAATPADLDQLRASAKGSTDPDTLGRWLLEEMLAPGGTRDGGKAARDRLAQTKNEHASMYAAMAVGLWDEVHGAPRTSAAAYVATLRRSRKSDDPATPLVAWFATHHLLGLRGTVPGLYDQHQRDIEAVINAPGRVGWRAVTQLLEWSASEAADKAASTGAAFDAKMTERMGCAKEVRLAGPFGKGTAAERGRSHAAERAPWPAAWPEEPYRGNTPKVLSTERHRCLVTSKESTEDGVFYAETYFDTQGSRELLVAVQGAVAVWVDDALALQRDVRTWGDWQRFGAVVRVGAGRHRLLARILGDAASVRLLNVDGTSARIETSSDASRPYGLSPATVKVRDPNPIDATVRDAAAGHASQLSPLMAALAGEAARVDGMSDVAAAFIEHVVTPKKAAPVALMLAALYARSDAALPDQVRRTTQREYFSRAAARDADLWFAQAWLVIEDSEQRGLVEAVEPLRALASKFSTVADVTEQLARVYGRLGWRAERLELLANLAKRFPDDESALRLYLGALEEDGSAADADKVAARIKKLEPDAEVDLDRALARRDWKAAIAELRRLEKRRPDRKELAGRIADVLLRSGDPSAAAKQLEKALAKNPRETAVRFRLADMSYARGDGDALRKALADALRAGAKGGEIRAALDLLEGASLLEPYRMNGLAVIKEFEAWEKKGRKMDGTAARVLDYAATWVHPDGASEMLEHEILRMQSQEAIGKEAEQQVPSGFVLRLRVIKPDGSILEPDVVAGKPTLTMPHLEVGDYVEIEHITPAPSDGAHGKRYRGPHWFFREADKGYWRSEFVVVTPKDREVEIETVGNVPKPKEKALGPFVERRWRVDESPPAPEEPDSPNPREFLPSVRCGWGVSLEDTLIRYVDAASDDTPLDPRLAKVAQEIVKNIPVGKRDARAEALYKFVNDSVQDGQDSDGRRAITGRSGSRQSAFAYLARLVDIPVELALVKSRIAPPPLGKMSELEMYDNLVLRLGTEGTPRWLTVRDKFAPYGYVPAELRGQPAIRLVDGTPRDTTAALGASDGVTIEGRADLRPDGSASVEIIQRYAGRMGIGMRAVFDKVPASQRNDFVETRLLARNLPGARLRDIKVENAEDLSVPFVLRMKADMPELARPAADGRMVLKKLFRVQLAQIASLPERQTPLLMATSSHVEVRFQVVAPEAMRMPSSLPPGEAKHADRSVVVRDRVAGHAIDLDRVVDLPAGRVQPGAEYAAFVAFVQKADELLEREIVLGK